MGNARGLHQVETEVRLGTHISQGCVPACWAVEEEEDVETALEARLERVSFFQLQPFLLI